MKYYEFYTKNKKIILIILIVLVLGIGFMLFRLLVKQNNNKTEQTRPMIEDLENGQENEEKKYVKTAISSDLETFLDPFSVHTLKQREMMHLLKTNFIDIKPNWYLAQNEGLSKDENDFSQIINNHVFTPGKLKPCYQLGLLKSYPKYYNNTSDINDLDSYISSEDSFKLKYDNHEDRARNIKSNNFLLQLRDDLQFEDGTKIDAETIKYTLEQYSKIISKFKTEENPELTQIFL